MNPFNIRRHEQGIGRCINFAPLLGYFLILLIGAAAHLSGCVDDESSERRSGAIGTEEGEDVSSTLSTSDNEASTTTTFNGCDRDDVPCRLELVDCAEDFPIRTREEVLAEGESEDDSWPVGGLFSLGDRSEERIRCPELLDVVLVPPIVDPQCRHRYFGENWEAPAIPTGREMPSGWEPPTEPGICQDSDVVVEGYALLTCLDEWIVDVIDSAAEYMSNTSLFYTRGVFTTSMGLSRRSLTGQHCTLDEVRELAIQLLRFPHTTNVEVDYSEEPPE